MGYKSQKQNQAKKKTSSIYRVHYTILHDRFADVQAESQEEASRKIVEGHRKVMPKAKINIREIVKLANL